MRYQEGEDELEIYYLEVFLHSNSTPLDPGVRFPESGGSVFPPLALLAVCVLGTLGKVLVGLERVLTLELQEKDVYIVAENNVCIFVNIKSYVVDFVIVYRPTSQFFRKGV